jgi:ABC-type nitrate/sulfonate/bicarbonate transport system substrate-binding protein
MNPLRLVVLFSLFCLAPSAWADTVKVSIISDSAGTWPLRVAEQKGYFTQEGLQVEISVTVDSQKQLAGLADGTFDITQQASDHFVRAVQEGKNVFVFMTISRPIFDFVVQRDVRTIADLKGKTIALDHPTTGYWLLFRKIFAQNGLPPDAYSLLPYLGGAEARWKAVQDGRAQGTFLNPPLSLRAISGGLTRLTGLAEHVPNYPATSGGARRDWAKQHPETLEAYLRANIRAIRWLSDPAHRDEALAIYAKRVKSDPKELAESYDTFIRQGLVPGAKLGMDGMQQMLELLVESGQLAADKARPELYADASYQEKAERAASAR